jgi:hypothetical protein
MNQDEQGEEGGDDARLTREVHECIWLDQPGRLEQLLREHPDRADRTQGIKAFHGARQRQLVNRLYRGQTPLGLAAELDRGRCIQVLLAHDADTTIPSALGFYPFQEAVSCGQRDTCLQIVHKRYWQVREMVDLRAPILYDKLQPPHLPDLYVEIDWRFHSWIPFLGNFLPSDRCRIWKRGNRVRLDSSIAGIEGYALQRGTISYFFDIDPRKVTVWIVDHDRRLRERIKTLDGYSAEEAEQDCNAFMRMELIAAKLRRSSDAGQRIAFVPVKAGPFGLGSDLRIDSVDGYACQVYDVRNLTYVSRTRREHLMERQRTLQESIVTPIDLDDLGSNHLPDRDGNIGDSIDCESSTNRSEEDADKNLLVGDFIKDVRKSRRQEVRSLPPPPPPTVSLEEYFGAPPSQDAEYVHVGRPLKIKEKRKALKGRLWMTNEHPLAVEQLMPLLELIAPSNRHFEKLRDFVDTDLPPGFPMRLDVPLFAVLGAEITFSHYQPWDSAQMPLPQALRNADPNHNDDDGEPYLPRGSFDLEQIFRVPTEDDGYVEGIAIKNVFKEN